MTTSKVKFPVAKAQNFNAIIAHLNALPADTVLDTVTIGSGDKAKAVEVTAELAIQMLTHEIDLLTKKNSAEKKLTEKQVQNEATKTAILTALAGDPDQKLTITDMIKNIEACAEMTNQKVSAIVRQMVNDDHTLLRTEEKGKAMFSLAAPVVAVEDDLTE